ncbi:hypothetical protein PCASD_04179 [Puccinia coronata f. sp. avenae]|uniref:Uncharacterized protein n=1 Tax=Puccinia coronata f. sp. avenae TaxID=200324 RepID=A0A2N5V812_9BASI|nr:hypothetical protein PCASD_04179 [Puccinia coronata f. sp. avenae]
MIFNAPVYCPSNGGGRRVAANRPHRPCSVAPTIMVTVLPACSGRQGRHVVTSRPHAVLMTEPSQVRRLSSEFVPLCTVLYRPAKEQYSSAGKYTLYWPAEGSWADRYTLHRLLGGPV